LTTSVLVSWNASPTATSYQVFRRSTGTGFVQITTTSATSYPDTVAAGAAYAYRVRAVNVSVSADSNTDVATTMTFSNEPLTPGVVPQAVHLSQMRTAVNYVRTLTGVPITGFTGAASTGVVMTAVQITELRSALDAALAPLGIAGGGYTDPSLAGVAIKAAHVQDIRNRVK
jgi:hypothetical protein